MTESAVRTITNEDYHKSPELSKSNLDAYKRSDAHFLEARAGLWPKPSKDFLIGNAVHCCLLESAEFDDRYVQGPENRRGDKFKEFVKYHEGREVLIESEWEQVEAMTWSVLNHPQANELLGHSKPELSYFWKDPTTGLDCRCRPDLTRNDGILVELKTVPDGGAHPEVFRYNVLNDKRQPNRPLLRYGVQAAFYLDGVNAALETDEYTAFIWIAVEKKPPYLVCCHSLGPDDYGRENPIIISKRKDYIEDLMGLQTFLARLPAFHQGKDYIGYPLRINEIKGWEK